MDISTVKLRCLICGKEATKILEKHSVDDSEVTLATIHVFYDRAKCSHCDDKVISMWSADNVLLIDGKNKTLCSGCNLPIIHPRLELKPFEGSPTCVVCAEPKKHRDPQVKWPEVPPEYRVCSKGHRTEIRRNSQTGEFFVGCTEFPICWWSRSLYS